MRLFFSSRSAAEAHVAGMKSKRDRARIERLPMSQPRPARDWKDLRQDSDALTYAPDPHLVVVEE